MSSESTQGHASASGSPTSASGEGASVPSDLIALLADLEAISRQRPDRVLRLSGRLTPAAAETTADPEELELLIFRGFSSSTTHPTAFDPDQPVLSGGVAFSGAELLRAPLNPAAEERLAGPLEPHHFRQPQAWL